MAANTGKLAGKVIFITGASRGIGRAIALKAAKDGANIVIAAKTKEPHPKLPGTIFSVAEEVVKAGGKCLPCVVDVRQEDQIVNAVNEAMKTFGRIDILVNNASAISLTSTIDTPMKTYDLMNSINARGTYLCSKICIPYMEKNSLGGHILNISPPLNMSPKWFANHVAYTMAKYGMSMCVLGMAEELKAKKIAVNALWPKTAIYTAAMEMLGGGKAVANKCRHPEIMADAAYSVFCEPHTHTGNFLIDEGVLRAKGVTDFNQYACSPGSDLILDFFLDHEEAGSKSSVKTNGESVIGKSFEGIKKLLNEEAVKEVGAAFAIILSGSEPGSWFIDLKSGSGSVGKLDPSKVSEYDVVMETSSENFVKIINGQLMSSIAFMSGDMKIKGNRFLAMKLEALITRNIKKE